MARYLEAHKDRKGPGDARPTALQLLRDEGMEGKLSGKVAIVTGGSSGLGLETARALHEAGVHVYLAVRDIQKGKEAAEDIQKSGQSNAAIDALNLELDSLDSVRSFASAFQEHSKTLNLLVANAGVMACPEGSTKDGFETQLGVNHLGHFLLFQLLKRILLSSSDASCPSRVVTVSSLGHRFCSIQFDDLDFKKQGYDAWKSYGQSKTANIYMANEIERRYGSQGLHATSVHPGTIVTTNLGRYLPPEAVESFKTKEMYPMLKSTEQGAATTIWAAVGKEWANKGGVYLEECQVSEPVEQRENITIMDWGYAPFAYDESASRRLWHISNTLVGLPEDE